MIEAPAYQLETLARPTLTGPAGPVELRDPRALALLVMLGLAGESGVAQSDLLLRLAPDLTPAAARRALDRLIEEINRTLEPAAVRLEGDRAVLEPGSLMLDVRLEAEGEVPYEPVGPRFLQSFQLPEAPEFWDWVESVRPRLAPAGDATEVKESPTNRIAQALLLLGLVLAGIVFWFNRNEGVAAAGVPAGTVVLLAEVENATGDSIFDRGLTTAAAVALQQSAQITLLTRSQISAALQRMGIATRDTQLVFALAREVAEREGVRVVVAPRILRQGADYRIVAAVLDVTTQRVVAEPSALAEGPGGVLPALDQVFREVRSTLGESQQDLRERSTPLAQVTTPSLEALRSYTDGARAWRRGEYSMARDLWLRALDIDTGFAMAMGSLGSYNYLHHDREEGRRHFEAAFARVHRLTEWERLQLLRSWAGYRGARDSAIALSRRIADRYPTAGTWYDLGTALMQASRCEEGLPAFARALSFDSSHVNTHINLAVCLRHTRPAEALEHFQEASRYDPNALLRSNIAFEYGATLVTLSLGDSARAHFTRLLDQPGLYERILGHRGLAWLALFGGSPRDAAGHFAAATEIARQQGANLSIARGWLAQGQALLAAGDSAGARQAFGQVMRVSRSAPLPPPFLAVFGHGLAVAKRLGDAETLLQQLRRGIDSLNQADRGAERLLEGSLALARGNAALALDRLSQVSSFPQQALVTLLRADALEVTGRHDSARALRASISKDEVWGTEAGFDWLRRVQR